MSGEASEENADGPDKENGEGNGNGGFHAHRCERGHVTYPGHTVCPTCGQAQVESISLADREGTVITWTTVTSTPPGVREPNTLAIVELDVDGKSVRALGQTTTDDIAVGDTVRPVAVERLRDPSECFRDANSQRWDGVRFEPTK